LLAGARVILTCRRESGGRDGNKERNIPSPKAQFFAFYRGYTRQQPFQSDFRSQNKYSALWWLVIN
jgi:hypothetical protein